MFWQALLPETYRAEGSTTHACGSSGPLAVPVAAAGGAQGRSEGRRYSDSLIYSSWNSFSLAWKGGKEGEVSRLSVSSSSPENDCPFRKVTIL